MPPIGLIVKPREVQGHRGVSGYAEIAPVAAQELFTAEHAELAEDGCPKPFLLGGLCVVAVRALGQARANQRRERAEIQRAEVALNIGPMRRALSTPGLGVNFCGRPTCTSAV